MSTGITGNIAEEVIYSKIGINKSEVVEDDGYLLTVLRYIHQNPLKAGIVKNIKQYPWSSYRGYIDQEDICETAFPLSAFPKDSKKVISLFKSFHAKENNDHCLYYMHKRTVPLLWMINMEKTFLK